jgi:hypothetical protein
MLNGQPIDCGELAEKAKPFIGLGIGILVFIIVISIVSFVFWLLMLIHAVQHKSPDRNTWIIVLVASFFTGFSLVGAIVYYFAEKKKAELATPPDNPPTGPPPKNDGPTQEPPTQ